MGLVCPEVCPYVAGVPGIAAVLVELHNTRCERSEERRELTGHIQQLNEVGGPYDLGLFGEEEAFQGLFAGLMALKADDIGKLLRLVLEVVGARPQVVQRAREPPPRIR